MRTIKQGKKDRDCVPAVAAMICGTAIEDFNKKMGKGRHRKWEIDGEVCGGGYCIEEIADYLSIYHKQVGIGCFLRRHIDFRKKTAILTFNILKFDAYVVVKSQRFKNDTHAVYWDRDIQMIRDPNPFLPARTKLNTYKIVAWHPIFNMSCAYNMVRKNPELKDSLKDFL